jgi:hypothetical protein
MTTLRGAPAMLGLTAMAVIILIAGFITGEVRHFRAARRAERQGAEQVAACVASLTPDEIEDILADSDWGQW